MSILAGLQSSLGAKDTYNGIGKSSSLQLIHLMLGGKFDSTVPSDVRLQKFLAGYGDFFLDLSVGTITYTIRVNFKDGIYYLNEDKVGKYGTFLKKLDGLLLKNKNESISFKQTFNCFARRYAPERNYYTSALQQQGQGPQDFYQRIANLHLLGFDINLPISFKKYKEDLEKIEQSQKALKNINMTEGESDLQDYKDELTLLIENKANFIIATDYDELCRKADLLTDGMNHLRNQIFKNEKEIRSTSNTLDQSTSIPSLDWAKVDQIYKEAEFHFPDQIHLQLKVAQDFHVKMHDARCKRLRNKINQLEVDTEKLGVELKIKEVKRDAILKDLDSKGALKEYNTIVDRIRTLESLVADLTSYQTTSAQLTKQKVLLESELANLNIQALEFIESEDDRIQKINSIFRGLVRKFYDHTGGAIKITKNDGQAKYLFDIDAYIPQDGSQGIGSVKIFCYDMLLFNLNKDSLGFMAHDSYLFGGVDPRQTKMIFKIALDMCKDNNFQYFVNVTEDVFKVMLNSEHEDLLTKEDQKVLKDSVILELFDAKPENTLFGQRFG